MNVRLHRFVIVGLGLISPVAATSARATEPEPGLAAPMQKADRCFADAVWLYAEGDLPGALAQFRRAYAAFPDFRVWYNIAGVLRELHDDAGSLRAYRKYLDGGAHKIGPDRRVQVERTLGELGLKIARIQVDVGGGPALVTVDGQTFSVATAEQVVEVNPGRHQVRVVGQRVPNQTRKLDVAAGERVRLLFEPTTVVPPAQPFVMAPRVPLSFRAQDP
jgi:hypothetical protein